MNTEHAKEIIKSILSLLDVSYDEVSFGQDAIAWIQIKTKEPALLIGRNGETLQSINYIVKKILENKKEDATFIIDINGYKKKEKEKIIEKANVFGERAKNFKIDIKLEPMSAYERLVIHEYFANDPLLYTESEGIGKNRCVILKYKDQDL